MSEATRLERASLVVHGDRSELRLEDGVITLVKEATTQARPTRVSTTIDRVRHVSFERPSRGRPGWLHLGVVDGSPVPPSELAATSDPYTLPLYTRHVPAARRLERMVNDHVRRRGLPGERADDAAGRRSSGVVVTTEQVTRTATPTLPPPQPAPPPAVVEAGPAPEPGPGAPPPTTVAAARPGAPIPPDRLASHLRELAELHESGALSDNEFEQAKRRVLGD